MVLDSKECKILNCWRIGKNGPIKNLILAAFRMNLSFRKTFESNSPVFLLFYWHWIFLSSSFYSKCIWKLWLSVSQFIFLINLIIYISNEIPRPKSYFYLLSSLKLKVFNPSIFLHRNSVSIILMFLTYCVSGFVINN